MAAYLAELARNPALKDWQFRQAVDAIRMLFVLAGVPWLTQVDWEQWGDSARALGRDHPTVARDYRPVPAVGPHGDPLPQCCGAGAEGEGSGLEGASFAAIRQAHGPLLDQVAAATRVRGLAIRTEQTYLHWIMRFIGFLGNQDPSGMRLMECVRLRVQDVDFGYNQIAVRNAKGGKDRVVPLPARTVDDLRAHLARVRELHTADLKAGLGEVYVPEALARKFPYAPKDWRWQYVFPSGRVSADPRGGVLRRHHLHETALQRGRWVSLRSTHPTAHPRLMIRPEGPGPPGCRGTEWLPRFRSAIPDTLTGPNQTIDGGTMTAEPQPLPKAMRATLGVLALGLTLAAPAQAALSFSIDPGALFSGAGAFTADTLLATEASHIAFTSATDWTEVGFARITGATLGGSPVTTAGLNADYSLYFSFQGTGREAANPGDPGSFTSMVMDLYAVAGAASFGIDGSNNAYIDTGGATPVKLAGTTFIDGTTSLVGTQMSATLLGHFTPLVPSFFTALPNPPLLFGDFHHVVGPGGDVSPVADGFVIQGGDDRLYFVPAPAPLALIAFAALGLPIRRRVPQRRRCRMGFASLYPYYGKTAV